MSNNFQTSMAFIWEGQNDGARKDRSPGETFDTVKGVTSYTWEMASNMGVVTGALEDANDEQLMAVYRVLYWNTCHCSSLPDGADLLVFNHAVLAGPGTSARLLQRVVGTEQDGAIGPITLRKANGFGVRALIDALTKCDLEYLSALANSYLFMNGWTRRQNEARALAYKMAGIKAPAPVAAPVVAAPDPADNSADALNAGELEQGS